MLHRNSLSSPYPSDTFWTGCTATSKSCPSSPGSFFFIVFAAEVHKWRKLPPAEKCGALASDLPESKSNLVLIIISNYKGEQ